MSDEPWRTEVDLDAERAAQTIASRFPELAPVRVHFLGQGGDYLAFLRLTMG